MSQVRERAVSSFILKKQDFGEADQIITLFSKAEGKVRALVKSAKTPTSKLQPMLQPVFQTRVTLTGHKDKAGLSKVIGVQMLHNYSGILESETKMGAWYVVSELLMRALPDAEPNEPLFHELEQYAQFLHTTPADSAQIKQSVIQFQIKALKTLGLGIRTFSVSQDVPQNLPQNLPQDVTQAKNVWFSIDRGGFALEDSIDAIPLRWQSFQAFQDLSTSEYSTQTEVPLEDFTPLSGLVNRFVTYQLDREIKSQQMLAST